MPFLSIPRYFPYPDFSVIFVSPTGNAVKISSGEGESPERQYLDTIYIKIINYVKCLHHVVVPIQINHCPML
jgi:hypothetical protein